MRSCLLRINGLMMCWTHWGSCLPASATGWGSCLPASQLKQVVGDGVYVSTLPPVLAKSVTEVYESDKVLDMRVKDGRREVLIVWRNLAHTEVTWEGFKVMAQQFPSFHLEDKVGVWGRSDDTSHFGNVYSRLKSKGVK